MSLAILTKISYETSNKNINKSHLDIVMSIVYLNCLECVVHKKR